MPRGVGARTGGVGPVGLTGPRLAVHGRPSPVSWRLRPVSRTKASSREAAAQLHILRRHPDPVERQDHGVDQLAATPDDHVLALMLQTRGPREDAVSTLSSKAAEGTKRTSLPPSTRCARPWGVSIATILPASNRATRSHSRSASSM